MKSTLKTVYIDKIKLLNKYSEHYYQKNNPLVTDQQFDNLKKEIIELEYEFINNGGKLIFPLPRLHIVDKSNYKFYLNSDFDDLAFS